MGAVVDTFVRTLVLLAVLVAPVAWADDARSGTIIGVDAALTGGAAALERGDYERGVRLTLAGLPKAASRRQRVAALSNLCAGYSGLARYDVALAYCDQALSLDPRHWRALQNRARIHVANGALDEAINDAEAGLAIAPKAPALTRILELARQMKRRPHVVMETFP